VIDEALAAVVCAAGGFVGGLVGVGGGVLFVPAMVVFLEFSQVDAEATSLLIIVFVAAAGAARQHRYGNVDLRAAAIIGALSAPGAAAGVVIANEVSERALQLAFAALALLMAAQLLRRAAAAEG
jgi:uncharacterized membrane protein YfcA